MKTTGIIIATMKNNRHHCLTLCILEAPSQTTQHYVLTTPLPIELPHDAGEET